MICACFIREHCYHDHDITRRRNKNECNHRLNFESCLGFVDPSSYDGLILSQEGIGL